MIHYTPTAEFRTWQRMIERCKSTDPNHWKVYGSRGIKVCDEWINSYEAFLAHIGPKPSRYHSIDRINNDGNYEPGNVRWATRVEQQRNTRLFYNAKCNNP